MRRVVNGCSRTESVGGREVLRQRYLALPAGERILLGTLKRMLRSAKRSREPGVARAARKWELRLGCFVRVRVENEKVKR